MSQLICKCCETRVYKLSFSWKSSCKNIFFFRETEFCAKNIFFLKAIDVFPGAMTKVVEVNRIDGVWDPCLVMSSVAARLKKMILQLCFSRMEQKRTLCKKIKGKPPRPFSGLSQPQALHPGGKKLWAKKDPRRTSFHDVQFVSRCFKKEERSAAQMTFMYGIYRDTEHPLFYCFLAFCDVRTVHGKRWAVVLLFAFSFSFLGREADIGFNRSAAEKRLESKKT